MTICCPTCGQTIKPPPKRRDWSVAEDIVLQEKITAGLTHKAIAHLLGRPVPSIGSRLVTLARKPNARMEAPIDIDEEDDRDPPRITVEERPGVRIVRHRIGG